MLETARKIIAGEPVSIVFFGDSITQGHYELNRDKTEYLRSDEVYHQLLHQRILAEHPLAKIRILNAGVGGQTADRGLARIKNEVLDVGPDLCVTCFGLNDVFFNKAHQYEKSMLGIFTALKDAGIEGICLTPNQMNVTKTRAWGLLLQLFSMRTARRMNDGSMDRFMDIARRAAQANGIVIADGYAQWVRLRAQGQDVDAMLCNAINHPDAIGHRVLADILYETMFET